MGHQGLSWIFRGFFMGFSGKSRDSLKSLEKNLKLSVPPMFFQSSLNKEREKEHERTRHFRYFEKEKKRGVDGCLIRLLFSEHS